MPWRRRRLFLGASTERRRRAGRHNRKRGNCCCAASAHQWAVASPVRARPVPRARARARTSPGARGSPRARESTVANALAPSLGTGDTSAMAAAKRKPAAKKPAAKKPAAKKRGAASNMRRDRASPVPAGRPRRSRVAEEEPQVAQEACARPDATSAMLFAHRYLEQARAAKKARRRSPRPSRPKPVRRRVEPTSSSRHRSTHVLSQAAKKAASPRRHAAAKKSPAKPASKAKSPAKKPTAKKSPAKKPAAKKCGARDRCAAVHARPTRSKIRRAPCRVNPAAKRST